jgi:hypothetical protein
MGIAMATTSSSVRITIGARIFCARLRRDLAPQSCACLEQLLPYRGKLIHARWSGESCWSPLAEVWHSGSIVAAENAVGDPAPGQILLYAGAISEPELLIPYGISRFACKDGPLAGNPVLTIEDGLSDLADLGCEILWHGAMDLRIEAAAQFLR